MTDTTHNLQLPALVDKLRNSRDYQGQIVHVREIPYQPPQYAEVAPPLPESLRHALTLQGIDKIYSHQVAAVDAMRAGRDCVIVTATASGKTLCYNLPVLERLLENPDARALYLFPTKALAQDQLRSLDGMLSLMGDKSISPMTYDGDTPQHRRKKIRETSRIILSNPDMLHTAVLPNHVKWRKFFANLAIVVIDEVHQYRGIFGSHAALLFRRLNRLAEYYRAKPQYLCASATIGNAHGHTEQLIGRPVQVIADNGAPVQRKTFVFWNPPIDKRDPSRRKSAHAQAERLIARLVKQGIKTIAFAKSRNVTELVCKNTRELLPKAMRESISSYRGGYLPDERRAVEKELFEGRLSAVVATSALELGIDVGDLDACVLVGYPGTIASTLQRAGRAGRSQRGGVVIIVPYDDPLDQYIVTHPTYLFDKTPEAAIINPGNRYILAAHLGCAAFELPLAPEDSAWFGEGMWELADVMETSGMLKQINRRWFWSKPDHPSMLRSLRSAAEGEYTIILEGEERQVLGTVDDVSAPMMVHPGAVYLHAGESYQVKSFDTERRVVMVTQASLDYFTRPMSSSTLDVTESLEQKSVAGLEVRLVFLIVIQTVQAFAKIRHYTLERLGLEQLELDPRRLSTVGCWIDFTADACKEVTAVGFHPLEGIAGLKNLLLGVLPLLAMCDRQDVGIDVDTRRTANPALVLYDRYEGGLGFAEVAYTRLDDLFRMALEILESCPCEHGCPACIGATEEVFDISQIRDTGDRKITPKKKAALLLLRSLCKVE
jgi:DEAD/DEAH box helicase domain-containing protein